LCMGAVGWFCFACVVWLVLIVQCAAVSSAVLGLLLVGGRPGLVCAAELG